MDLHTDDMSLDQDTVIDRLLRSDMLANRLDNHRLDLGCGHARHRSDTLSCAIEQSGRQIVAVLDAGLAGMGGAHAIAGIIEDAAGQRSL